MLPQPLFYAPELIPPQSSSCPESHPHALRPPRLPGPTIENHARQESLYHHRAGPSCVDRRSGRVHGLGARNPRLRTHRSLAVALLGLESNQRIAAINTVSAATCTNRTTWPTPSRQRLPPTAPTRSWFPSSTTGSLRCIPTTLSSSLCTIGSPSPIPRSKAPGPCPASPPGSGGTASAHPTKAERCPIQRPPSPRSTASTRAGRSHPTEAPLEGLFTSLPALGKQDVDAGLRSTKGGRQWAARSAHHTTYQ